MYRLTVRIFTWIMLGSLRLAEALVPRPRPRDDDEDTRVDVLLTGTFYTEQWLATHLRPLARSPAVRQVTMVASRPVPDLGNVVAVYPPPAMQRALGEVLSRSLVFIWCACRDRPHVIGGFHLLLNGMLAAILARLLQRRSLYFCGGGPREVLGGGYTTENRIYGRLGEADPWIEARLLRFVDAMDTTICMGTSAVDYFADHGVRSRMEIVPGGFPTSEFHPADEPAEFDFILVGRLSEVKRADLFIEAVGIVARTHPGVRAVIVGDGPDKAALEAQVRAAGLVDQVHFAGWQSDVAGWLQRARVFVLTSSSEGLSQALLQGLMCGLPAVVSNVGDLSDAVTDGVNGYLVDSLDADSFAERFLALLDDPERYAAFRAAALEAAAAYEVPNVAAAWAPILLGTDKPVTRP